MFRYAGGRNAQCCARVLQQRRRCFAAIATTGGSDTAKRRTRTVHHAAALPPRSGNCLPLSPSMPVHAHHAAFRGVGGLGGVLNTRPQRQLVRHLSTRRGGLPPGRSFPEKIFAGVVVTLLAAWGLIFGAITLLLLPFVGIALFLLRRNFQRGGVSRNLAAGLVRKMAERGGAVGGGFGGGDGGGVSGVPWMQRAPTEGVLSSLLATMLGGALRGMELVRVLRSEVEKRALRHPGLSSALGGGVEAFSDVEMSTVGSVGGAPDGGRHGQVPSRVIKARLRFSGKRAGPGGAGWAEVEVTDWQGAPGEEQGMEFDRISVTLDSGRKFDLTGESFADDGNVEQGRTAQFLRRGHHGSSNSSGNSSSSSSSSSNNTRAGKAARGRKNSRRTAGDRGGGGRPVEAEFRDK